MNGKIGRQVTFQKTQTDRFSFAFHTKFKEVISDLSLMSMILFPFLFTLGKAISAHGHLIPQKGIIYSTTTKLRASELQDSVTEDESSEVEESDIWKIVGNYLYFLISEEVCKSLI